MTRKHCAGSALTSILLVLVILVGLGGWNYKRNFEAEKAVDQYSGHSKFSGYSDQDLVALVEAYRIEVERSESTYRKAKAGGTLIESQNSVQSGVREFERVKAANAQLDLLKEEVAKTETRLQEVEAEQGLRARGGAIMDWQAHVRLLTTL